MEDILYTYGKNLYVNLTNRCRKIIAKKFREADAILIGASNGLSITEGLHLFADMHLYKCF